MYGMYVFQTKTEHSRLTVSIQLFRIKIWVINTFWKMVTLVNSACKMYGNRGVIEGYIS